RTFLDALTVAFRREVLSDYDGLDGFGAVRERSNIEPEQKKEIRLAYLIREQEMSRSAVFAGKVNVGVGMELEPPQLQTRLLAGETLKSPTLRRGRETYFLKFPKYHQDCGIRCLDLCRGRRC